METNRKIAFFYFIIFPKKRYLLFQYWNTKKISSKPQYYIQCNLCITQKIEYESYSGVMDNPKPFTLPKK